MKIKKSYKGKKTGMHTLDPLDSVFRSNFKQKLNRGSEKKLCPTFPGAFIDSLGDAHVHIY